MLVNKPRPFTTQLPKHIHTIAKRTYTHVYAHNVHTRTRTHIARSGSLTPIRAYTHLSAREEVRPSVRMFCKYILFVFINNY